MRVIIPCRNSIHTIQASLEALRKSTLWHEMDIVLADDGNNPNLLQIVQPYPVKIIAASQNGNAGIARNVGASGYRGDILVFLDADVLIEPNAINALIQPIRQGIADATVGSYSNNANGLNFAQTYKHLYLSTVYSQKPEYIHDHFWTALSAIRTSVFFEAGGFSSQFQGACGEDMELGQRLTRCRKSILTVPSAQGRHIKQYTIASLIHNDFKKGSNCIYLSISNKTSITHNRHSKSNDMISVCYACGIAILVLLSWPLSIPYVAMVAGLPILIIIYLLSRNSLIDVFKPQGNPFLVKAIMMMFVLDIVRGICVLNGLRLAILYQIHQLHPFTVENNQ